MSIYNHSSLSNDNFSLSNKHSFTYPYSINNKRQPPIYSNSFRNNDHTSRYIPYKELTNYNTVIKNKMLENYKRATNRSNNVYSLDGYCNDIGYQTAFQGEINMRMLDKHNELIAIKDVFEKQLQQNRNLLQMENDYCERMKKVNEELVQQISDFANENERLNYERKKLQMDYAMMEEDINYKLLYLMKTTRKDPKLQSTIKDTKSQIQIINEESEDESIKESKNKNKLIKEKIYSLNFNQTSDKLYEIRKKILEDELKKEQQQLKRKIRNKTFHNKYKKPILTNTSFEFEDHKNDIKDNEYMSQTIQPESKMYSTIKASAPVINEHSISVRKQKTSHKRKEKQSKTKQNVNENIVIIGELTSIYITPQEKLNVLQKTIEKIYEYMKLCKKGTIIYKECHTNTSKYKKEIRFLYEQIKIDQNINVNVNLLPMLVFEILHSNYEPNLNSQNLTNKIDYNENDFDNDLNEAYSEIFIECLNHLKKLTKKKYTTKSIASYFLSVALLNFEYDESILNRLIKIIECKL